MKADYSALVEKLKKLIEVKPKGVVSLSDVKSIVKKSKGTGFRKFIGKTILIRDIQFDGDKAIVTVEVDGSTETLTTRDKMLIKRYFIDFKAALDMGAEAIKVKVEPLGKSSVKFT